MSQRQMPGLSEKTKDTLEATLANVNIILTMINSLGSMNKALGRFTDCPRPRHKFKRGGEAFRC